MRRRTFHKVLLGGAVAGAAVLIPRHENHPGRRMSPAEFYGMALEMEEWYGYPTTYIPQEMRRPNTDGSCVHLSTANILTSLGRSDLAQMWLDSYRHGEYSSRHIRRMEAEGLYFAVETDGDPNFIDHFAGNTGAGTQRVMGVSYLTRHVLNLLDIDPANHPNPQAYILNNQRRGGVWNWDSLTAAEVPRDEFLRGWDRRGGWAFTILGTKQTGVQPPVPPYPVLA